MTQEEWLGDYFGTTYEDLHETISSALAPPLPTPPPQATPSELPSPPTPPLSRIGGAVTDYVKNILPDISLSDLNQEVQLPPASELTQWQNQQQPMVSTMLPHQIPFQNEPASGGPRVREFLNAEGQDQWNKGFALMADIAGSARFLEGGGLPSSLPIPRRFRPSRRAITGMEELGPALPLPPNQVTFRPSSPATGKQYLESFRNAVANDDVAGAKNILGNAMREDTRIPFSPNDFFNSYNPFITRELDRYMLNTGGFSPYRAPGGLME